MITEITDNHDVAGNGMICNPLNLSFFTHFVSCSTNFFFHTVMYVANSLPHFSLLNSLSNLIVFPAHDVPTSKMFVGLLLFGLFITCDVRCDLI